MKRSVLVTGGAGYIGSHLCKRLAAEGWEPVVLDDLSIGNAWAVKWGPLIEADLLDDTALAAVFEEYRPAAVMHLAALSSVAESMRAPERYREVNVTGTAKLVAAMRRAGVPHLVFSSSASVYGLPERSPIGEDHPLRPINVYGETKLEAEQLLAGPALAEGVAAVSLRYFNAAGADPAGEIGERRREESHLIPLAMEVAAGRRPVLELHGRDYATPDGTGIRDYVHVTDIAAAHIRALEYLHRGGTAAAFNLGSDRGFSVLEVIEALRSITGREIPLIERPRRPGDPDCLVGDSAAARERLGWRPEHSDLESILVTAWRWAQARAAAAG